MVLSVVIALVTVWTGIAVSYQSNWPLGFFVGALGAASSSPAAATPPCPAGSAK